MFKLFWVWADDDHHWHDHHDDHEVEIIHSDEETLDDEVWQVALDVLEAPDNIFIIAPIAWVEYEDIDLSINKTPLVLFKFFE